MRWSDLNPRTWWQSFVAYQKSNVFGDFGGPSNYQPPALHDDTQVLSKAEQEIDEAKKLDPDPTIAPGVK